MADLVEPLENLYTCGEAYSDYQGWVEGALRSADLVLKKAFKMKPISEVYEDEHHGVSPSAAIKASYAIRSTEMIRKYIDPKFDPDAKSEDIDAPNVDASKLTSFGISLTYFDQR